MQIVSYTSAIMICLKSLSLKTNVIQSPMAGCTDLAFRLVSRSYGMKFAFLEMVAAEPLIRMTPKTLRMLKRTALDSPLGAQLVGCSPELMGEAAQIIEGMGFDLLDINLGCPVSKVVAPGGGSALLAEPETAKKIFQRVVSRIKRIPVTVKMRKGFQDPSAQEAIRIAKIAEDSGISAVTIHGRTRVQGYSGAADWDSIRKVKEAVHIPVFGNGDVLSGEDAKRLRDVSGCDGIMVGRGGLGNPWIYQSIDARLENRVPPFPSPSLEDRKKAALMHLKLECDMEGERVAVLKSRRIMCWYFKNDPGSHELRNRINRTQSAHELEQLIREFTSAPLTTI